MKRIVIIATLLMCTMGLRAQDCDAIMLPYFNNDPEQMANYKQVALDKFEQRCFFARSAFYESDTVPAGAEVFSITEVIDQNTGKPFSKDYVVDMTSIGYYNHNFRSFHLRYRTGSHRVCFSTPASAHPYLVMRSVDEMGTITSEYFNNKTR